MEDNNLSRKIKYWLTEADHDFYFTIVPEKGATERIGVVKHILLAHSEPLRNFLMDPSKVGNKKELLLKGVEPQTFRNLLKCVYGAANSVIPSLSFDELAKLLYLIEMYEVYDYKPDVVSRLRELLTRDDIFIALSHPVCFKAGDLTNEIKAIFHSDIDQILTDKRFLNLSDITIMWIVQQELFNVEDMKIWSAILKWAETQVTFTSVRKVRADLFDILKNMHSIIMKIRDFSRKVSQIDAGALLKSKASESYQSFGSPPKVKKACTHLSNMHTPTCDKMSSGLITTSTGAIITSSIKIKEVKKFERSALFEYCDYSWQIQISKGKQPESSNETFLGCYLWCKSVNPIWSCKVAYEFILVNTKSGSNVTESNAACEFNDRDLAWGRGSFYNWNALVNPCHGFLRDDSIVLMVHFKIKE